METIKKKRVVKKMPKVIMNPSGCVAKDCPECVNVEHRSQCTEDLDAVERCITGTCDCSMKKVDLQGPMWHPRDAKGLCGPQGCNEVEFIRVWHVVIATLVILFLIWLM